MALFEDALKGSVAGVFLVAGVAIAAPILLPALAVGARPLAKGLIRGYLALAEQTREMAAETSEKWSDLVAEARSEQQMAATTHGNGHSEHQKSTARRSRSRKAAS